MGQPTGHEQYPHVRLRLNQANSEIRAALTTGQDEIRNQEINSLAGRTLLRFLCTARFQNGVTVLTQEQGEEIPHAYFVFQDEDRCHKVPLPLSVRIGRLP